MAGHNIAILGILAIYFATILCSPTKNIQDIQWNPEEGDRYFEGDILVRKSNLRNGVIDTEHRWMSRVVPFEITGNFTYDELLYIHQAIESYHTYTCITFTCKRDTDTEFIEITNEPRDGCVSYIGRQPFMKQTLNLASSCFFRGVGTPIHELMHSVGFWHEQSGSQRDEYITINWQNVKEDSFMNFMKRDDDDYFGQKYDYTSVMHYPPLAFSRNGLLTITPKKGNYLSLFIMGQRKGFSKTDITKINAMYGCPELTEQLDLQENTFYSAKHNYNIRYEELCINNQSVE